MNKNNPPIIELDNFTLSDSGYKRGQYVWTAKQLYKEVKKQNLKPFDFPLAGFNTTLLGFRVNDTYDFVYNMRRVLNADLKYPIIFDDSGQIADGYHRICKAILEGKSTIKAYRLNKMPPYDHSEEITKYE